MYAPQEKFGVCKQSFSLRWAKKTPDRQTRRHARDMKDSFILVVHGTTLTKGQLCKVSKLYFDADDGDDDFSVPRAIPGTPIHVATYASGHQQVRLLFLSAMRIPLPLKLMAPIPMLPPPQKRQRKEMRHFLHSMDWLGEKTKRIRVLLTNHVAHPRLVSLISAYRHHNAPRPVYRQFMLKIHEPHGRSRRHVGS